MNIKKVCTCCGLEKPISEYYERPQKTDGHFNKCKLCVSKSNKEKRSTLDAVELLRAKDRERYYRRGYKDKHKNNHELSRKLVENYNKKYPEKYYARSASSTIQSPPNIHKHHWSYNENHWIDVLFLTTKEHTTAHRFIVYDQERMMYRTLDGVLLDTRESHENYINKYFIDQLN